MSEQHQTGWVCPLCKVVNSPYKLTCACSDSKQSGAAPGSPYAPFVKPSPYDKGTYWPYTYSRDPWIVWC